MRRSHAIDLKRMREHNDFTTILVSFKGWNKPLTYKALRSDEVRAGGHVVVRWPEGEYRVGFVLRVDEMPLISGTEPYDFKWIVEPLKMLERYEIMRMEEQRIEITDDDELEELLVRSLAMIRERKHG